MKVLVATRKLQGMMPGDFFWSNEGELVKAAMQCSSPSCGCDRAFAGLDSHKSTTTAEVVDRPDVTPQTLKVLVRANLESGGWLGLEGGNDESMIEAQYADTLALYAEVYDFEVGTVVAIDGALLKIREVIGG
jgi:hypothetical protein